MKNKFDGEEYFKELKFDANQTLKNVEKEIRDDLKKKNKSKEFKK